jgi:LCP family protein required for cell wall assembly
MYDFVPAAQPELFPDPKHAGGEVMKASVGEALGLSIDYYAVVNLAGFERLINALGGVTVNINSYVAMGGSTDAGRPPEKWLSPGPDQHLDGNSALWYARGRFGSDDYERMARQRCVMNALADQANVPTLLGRYEAIAREFQSVVLTDVPQDDLPAVLDLALLMRQANMRSIVFTNGEGGFWSADPDFDAMRDQVQQAIEESHEPPAAASTAPARPADSPAPEPTERTEPTVAPTEDSIPSPSPTPTTASENVRDACAYDPQKAQEAIENPPYWVE